MGGRKPSRWRGVCGIRDGSQGWNDRAELDGNMSMQILDRGDSKRLTLLMYDSPGPVTKKKPAANHHIVGS